MSQSSGTVGGALAAKLRTGGGMEAGAGAHVGIGGGWLSDEPAQED